MTPFILAFLTFILIPFGVYFVIGWFVFYHLKNYGIRGDTTKQIAVFFSIVLTAISLLMLTIFLSINWDKVNMEDFIEKSKINLSPNYYE